MSSDDIAVPARERIRGYFDEFERDDRGLDWLLETACRSIVEAGTDSLVSADNAATHAAWCLRAAAAATCAATMFLNAERGLRDRERGQGIERGPA